MLIQVVAQSIKKRNQHSPARHKITAQYMALRLLWGLAHACMHAAKAAPCKVWYRPPQARCNCKELGRRLHPEVALRGLTPCIPTSVPFCVQGTRRQTCPPQALASYPPLMPQNLRLPGHMVDQLMSKGQVLNLEQAVQPDSHPICGLLGHH